MNSVKKILVSLKTQINHVVDDFENHEALATLAIDEMEKIGRDTRVQLNRIRKQIADLKSKSAQEMDEVEKWTQRAIKLEATDPDRALNCVKRLKQAERQAEIFNRQHQELINQEKKVVQNLAVISEQIGELKSRRENLIARQNRNQATGCVGGANRASDARTIFDRWENSVVGGEFEIPEENPGDPFEEDFEKQEHEEELKATLAMLVEKNRKA